jgi:hypothetical protein
METESKIKGRYHIADCECNGDIEREINFLHALGCYVTNSSWDRKDGGDAYIEFEFAKSNFQKVYSLLIGSSVSFSADINDYMEIESGYMDNKTLMYRLDELAENVGKNFEKVIPLHLFFEVRKDVNIRKFVNEVLDELGPNAAVLGQAKTLVDGYNYYDAVIVMDYKDLTAQKLLNIGHYCLGNKSFSLMEQNGLYGDIKIKHVLSSGRAMWSEDDVLSFRAKVENVMDKYDLRYINTNIYSLKDYAYIHYSEYMGKDGKIIKRIEKDGQTYCLDVR